MELKDFVKKALKDITEAVDEAENSSLRELYLINDNEKRAVEFDIAVTVEKQGSATGEGSIRVLKFLEGSGGINSQTKNSTASRITFGVHVERLTKENKRSREQQIEAINQAATQKMLQESRTNPAR